MPVSPAVKEGPLRGTQEPLAPWVPLLGTEYISLVLGELWVIHPC